MRDGWCGFLGWDIAGCWLLAVGWIVEGLSTRAADMHVEICQCREKTKRKMQLANAKDIVWDMAKSW